MEFSNKTVFITGAAKGQGRACALAFAKEGANIIGFDLKKKIEYPAYNDASSEDLEKLKSDVIALGAKCVVYGGDVRSEEDQTNAAKLGYEAFGSIDVLFANAGICAYSFADEMPVEAWDTMVDINLKGGFLSAKACIPYMKAQKSGVIIFNSSVGGMRGMRRLSHYAASKWGLVGLSKSLAIELAPYGVRVLTIHPTGVNTPLNDGLAAMEGKTPEEIAEASAGNLLPVPWIEPQDVADSVLFLAGDKAKYVTGSQYVLDAGLLTR